MMECHFRSTKPKGTLAFFSCWFMAISLSAQTLTNFVLFGGTNGADTADPLVQGADGNLYGTTNRGGAAALGTIFEGTPGGTLTTLHSFSGALADGSPEAGLTLGADGNFYGTTPNGGTYSYGTVFKITPGGVFTTLASFSSAATGIPTAPLVQATDGNFYGTTTGYELCCGLFSYGTIFRITPEGSLTVLHTFESPDAVPGRGALIQPADGSLYGASYGSYSGNTVYPGASTR